MRRSIKNSIAWAGLLTLTLLVLAPTAPADDAYAAYEEALVRFEKGDLEGSLLELKQALATNANLLPGHILLARIYLRIGEGAAAQDSLRKTRRLGGDPAILEPLLVEALLQQRKFKEVVAREIGENLPADVRAELLVARAKAQISLGALIDAEASLDQATTLAPTAVAPRVTLADLALRKGDVHTASVRAQAVVRVAPDDPDAWYVSGSVHHTLGRLDQALESYHRALDLDAEHYDARVSRAGLLVDQQRFDEAQGDIAHLRANFPLDPRAAYLESVFHAQQGEPGRAREALERAAALLGEMPDTVIDESPQLQLLAGIANYELESFEQAQSHLNRYMDRYPQQAGPRKIVGAILVGQGRVEEAIQILEPALRTAPNDFRVLALLGTAYMQRGRHDVATPYLEKAVRLSGGATELRARLAMSRIAQGFDEQGQAELAAVFEDDPARNGEAGVALAVTLMQSGRASEALEVTKKLRDALPGNLTVLNLMASAQLSSGLADRAERTFREILTIDPDHMPAGVNLATIEASRGDFDAATTRLEAMLERQPDSVRTMVELARVEERAGRVASALRWMQKARDAAPENVPAAIGLVDLNLRMGEPAVAIEVAREAEALAPEDLRVLAALARAHVSLERLDLAKNVYLRMARIAGFDVGELYDIAGLQLSVGAGEDAIYTLHKALQADPAHLRSRVLLVESELAHGDPREALALAEELLADHPELAASYRLLGGALARLERHADAAERYARALELEPTTGHLLALYRSRRAAGEGQAARALLVDWVGRHPDDGLARLALAEDHLGAGELTEARRHYEAVLEVAPGMPQVLNNLAHILEQLGEPGAIEMARRAHRAAPDDPAVGDTLGWMLVRRGEPAEGLRYLRDAQSRASGSAEIRYHVAAALAALERREEALRELRRALASTDDFAGVEDARELLRKLGG